MSKFENNKDELNKQKALYILEKKVSHIHKIDSNNIQIFFEDIKQPAEQQSERIKKLEEDQQRIEAEIA